MSRFLSLSERLKYILWLQDLIDSTSPDYREGYDARREVIGLDVGTGASAIYPLLGTRQRPNWRYVATECDDRSLEYARANVTRNGLAERIHVLETQKDDLLVPLEVLARFERIDFVQTNPPFYTSTHELLTSSKRKSRPPNSVCTGSASEMMTAGGEIGFVARLISQSSSLCQSGAEDKVQWWSSMLGKLSSVAIVVERLKKEGCGNWAVGEFVQGGKTRRWVVAWSWLALRPSVAVARGVRSKALKVGGKSNEGGRGPLVVSSGQSGVGAIAKRQVTNVNQENDDEDGSSIGSGLEGGLLPFPSEFNFSLQSPEAEDISRRLNHELSRLPGLQWQWKSSLAIGLGVAHKGDCWSRKARRRMNGRKMAAGKQLAHHDQKEDKDSDDDEDHDNNCVEGDEEEEEAQFVFKIEIRPQQQPSHRQHRQTLLQDSKSPRSQTSCIVVAVRLRWLQGRDHVLFESFCGWLKRKLDVERK